MPWRHAALVPIETAIISVETPCHYIHASNTVVFQVNSPELGVYNWSKSGIALSTNCLLRPPVFALVSVKIPPSVRRPGEVLHHTLEQNPEKDCVPVGVVVQLHACEPQGPSGRYRGQLHPCSQAQGAPVSDDETYGRWS